MIGEAMMGVSAFKAAMDMAKAMKDIDDRTRRNEVAIELQEKILGAQAAQAALVQQVHDLEEEVTRLKAWDAEKEATNLPALETEFSLMPRKNPCAAANHLIIFVQTASLTGKSRSSKKKSQISGVGPFFFAPAVERRFGPMAVADRLDTNLKRQQRGQEDGDLFPFGGLPLLHLGLFLQRLMGRVHCALKRGFKAGLRFFLAVFIRGFFGGHKCLGIEVTPLSANLATPFPPGKRGHYCPTPQ
jgi:hypothetical protein